MRLFRQFIIRHLLEDRLRTGASIVGVALGIGVVVAVHLANASSFRGFEAAVESIAGKTSLEIVGPGVGVDENLLPSLAWLREFGRVSPVIEGDALVQTGDGMPESVRVLGVDILRDWPFREYRILQFEQRRREPRPQEVLDLLVDPHSIILTERFAGRHGIEVGSSVELTIGDRIGTFAVRGLLMNEGPARTLDGNFALMDIAAAQLAFNRFGRIDRIDLRLAPDISLAAAESAVAARLPSGLNVQFPERRGRQVEKMLRAFQFNLAALSYIALLVGLFLIYNTVSISVITRREEIGMLRALGVKRGGILRLFLGEALVLSAAGCALGLILGRYLADFAVQLTSTTVSSLYIAAAATPPRLDTAAVLLAFAAGIPLSLLAAALPALEAARSQPATAARGIDRFGIPYRLRRRALIGPVLLLTISYALSRLGPVGGLPVFGYASALALVFASAFLVPAVLRGLGRAGSASLTRLFRVEGLMANANLNGSISRIAISVSALAVSLAMMAAIAVMIGSFRETIVQWVGQTLKADLYIRPLTRTNVATEATVSQAVEDIVSAHRSVAAVDRFRNFDVPYQNGLVTLAAGDFSVMLARGNLLFKAPRDARSAVRDSVGRDAVVASESYVLKYQKDVGDLVDIPTPSGPVGFRVAAVYYDYSSDRGVLVMDRSTLARHFGLQRPTSLSVYLAEGADPEAVRREILSDLGDRYRLFIYTNASLRREILRVFDSTFSITYALEIIAVFVAMLGVASTLLTLILERRREVMTLRLIGAERRQVRKMVVIEAVLIGIVSQGVGIAVGLLLSTILIYVINVQSFGWTIQFHLPAGFLLRSSVLIIVATGLSGLYPARRAAQLPMPAPMREE